MDEFWRSPLATIRRRKMRRIEAIGAACRGIRIFYITGHGVARETRERVFGAAAQLCQGPARVKDALGFSGAGG